MNDVAFEYLAAIVAYSFVGGFVLGISLCTFLYFKYTGKDREERKLNE